MEKYGNDVLAQYHMPTNAEIAQLKEYEAEEEGEEINLTDPMDEDEQMSVRVQERLQEGLWERLQGPLRS